MSRPYSLPYSPLLASLRNAELSKVNSLVFSPEKLL